MTGGCSIAARYDILNKFLVNECHLVTHPSLTCDVIEWTDCVVTRLLHFDMMVRPESVLFRFCRQYEVLSVVD